MDNKSIDNQLRKAFAEQLPQAPNNPWFTRKVMNRLPEKHRNWGNIIEFSGFAIAAIVLGVFWYAIIGATLNSTTITIGNLINFAIMTLMTIGLSIGFMLSLLRRV